MSLTPHNSAEKGQIARTVLMPGDPLRAKYIAKNFLSDAVLVNDIRGINGYTGTYQGHTITVMASGMGIPSIGIYSYELYTVYDVENIIRIGSAGAVSDKLKLRDIVAGIGACTDSNWASQYGVRGTVAPVCSYELLKAAQESADGLGISLNVGPLLSSDSFYGADETAMGKWKRLGVLAVEMEAAGLYMNAMYCGKRALALCTISDIPATGEECTPQERQNTFTDMMKIALETAVKMDCK